MKLIKLSDYVLEVKESLSRLSVSHNAFEFCKLVENRAKLLKQKPELGMFIPCDLDGNVLKDPELTMLQGNGHTYYSASDVEFQEYQEAKERVLFKRFVYVKGELYSSELYMFFNIYNNTMFSNGLLIAETLEDLVPYELELNREL